MRRYLDLLDQLKKKRALKCDAQLARLLGIDRRTLSDHRNGVRNPDTYACIRLAIELEIDPLALLAEVQAQLEEGERGKWWKDFLQRARRAARTPRASTFTSFCAAALGASMALSSLPPAEATSFRQTDAKPLTYQHIIRNGRRRARNTCHSLRATHGRQFQCYLRELARSRRQWCTTQGISPEEIHETASA